MKKLSILALSATIITAPAFAETTTYPTPSVELSTQVNEATDLSFAFDDTQNLQVKEMTLAEMQETEGAWVANAISAGYGGLSGGIAYTSATFFSGSKWSFKPFAGSVAGGAVAGAFLNPLAGATIGSAAGGAIAGYSSRKQ